MAKYDYDLVVLGGGAAGLTTVSGAAQLGARTLLVEKENALGGDCLHYGCVPSKTLIKSAAVYWQMKHCNRFGLPEVELPPVDFSKIAGRIRKVVSTIQHHDSVERFTGLGAEVVFAEPKFIDEHSLTVGKRTISARKIVIATGSRAAVPEIDGLESAGYITNRELFSLEEMPKKLIVLGGGPIAMEMAQAFSRFGAEVVVIQRSRQILSREDPDIASTVMEALERSGVVFHLGSRIARVESDGDKKRVFLHKDGAEITVEGDTVFVAMGRVANIEIPGLTEIGIALEDNTIAVDPRMRTNHRHIYAAGDVTGGYQFTHAAGYEGGIVIANAIFNLPRKADYTWMPWCTYTSPGLASIGMNEKRATETGKSYSVVEEMFAENDRAITEEEISGRLKLLLDDKDKPLGVQIVGPQAGDILSEWVTFFNGRLKLSQMAGAIHAYPTFSEINKKAAGHRLGEKIFSARTRKILKFLFQYRG